MTTTANRATKRRADRRGLPESAARDARTLQYGITIDEYEHPPSDDGRDLSIWVWAHVTGPVEGREANVCPGQTSCDSLVLESEKRFTETELDRWFTDLSKKGRARLLMHDLCFFTEFPPGEEFDPLHEEEMIPLDNEIFEVTLKAGQSGHLDTPSFRQQDGGSTGSSFSEVGCWNLMKYLTQSIDCGICCACSRRSLRVM